MRKEVLDKMLNDYNSLKIKARSSCVKYRYEHNKVNVNIYFDAYDKESYTFVLVLVVDKKYYFTTIKKQSSFEMPFWWHIRKIPMSNLTVEKLCERADISRKALLEIQKKVLL